MNDEKKPRGHILIGMIKQVVDHPEPAQEAEQRNTGVAAFADFMIGWAERRQRRSKHWMRTMLAVQETAAFAKQAFADAADDALVDDETDEVAATDTRIKGLHPESDRVDG